SNHHFRIDTFEGGIGLKLVSFYQNNEEKLGVKVTEGIIDVDAALNAYPSEGIPTNITSLIHGGEEVLQNFSSFINGLAVDHSDYILLEDEIEWAPALTNPEKIICVGLNYRKHADETKAEYPK